MKIDPRLHRIVAAQPYPMLFATISGAHLYGFPSPDSDFDLRGAHILPLEKIAGLDVHDETVEDSRIIEGLEMDIVSHDIRKFFGMLLKKNGYVLEQLFSPLIVHTTPEHEELKAICNPRHFDTSPCPAQEPQSRAGVSPAPRARQREQCVGFADAGRRDACPTLSAIAVQGFDTRNYPGNS